MGCQTCGGFGDRHDPIAHGEPCDRVCREGDCDCDVPLRCCGVCPGKCWLRQVDERGFFTYDEHGRRVTE